ncbi:MAG: metallophosphoesterase family protein [Microcoleaceae cyanobacterium]
MKFVSDPPILTKVRKMQQRVRWQERSIRQRQIDQTQLQIDDGQANKAEFSFLVIGDSGTGHHMNHSPHRKIAELLVEQAPNCRFLLHTGDVVYHVGSSEYYQRNFIAPYREFLVNGQNYQKIAYDQMVFNFPFLPVLGNHDYYDLPLVYGMLSQLTWLPRRLVRNQIEMDIGWHGSNQGDAYARAFLDYLQNLEGKALEQHLDQHYTAKADTGNCLRYVPGQFTRLPNRYYSFRYGGVDFFALDSSTFNAPAPIPDTEAGNTLRYRLKQRSEEIDRQKQWLQTEVEKLSNSDQPEALDDLEDNLAKLEYLEESQIDIEKRLQNNQSVQIDLEQLDWLQSRLIQSWQNSNVRGRVLYFHHPPYVTEATKWEQGQTLEVRFNLRRVLDEVAVAVGELAGDRPLVDLVLNGHAHCLEYLQTGETGHGDANMHWLICGGSGHSLRYQRSEGPELKELRTDGSKTVAQSHLFIGRNSTGRKPYSGARIDVLEGEPLKFRVQPLVAERTEHWWRSPIYDPFVISPQEYSCQLV